MSQQNREAKALKRQIRYVLKTSGGRLELGEARLKLLKSIGRFIDRMKFGSREETARALGIRPSKINYLLQCYRKLPQIPERAKARNEKKLKLARVKIVDEPMKGSRSESRRVEMVFEGGVRVSVDSADAAIDLLDRLEQRKRLKSAS